MALSQGVSSGLLEVFSSALTLKCSSAENRLNGLSSCRNFSAEGDRASSSFFQPVSSSRSIETSGQKGRYSFAIKAEKSGFGLLQKLGRVLKEKASSDLDRILKGVSKTRQNLAVVDELLLYWKLEDSEKVLEELEEALIISDFGPRTTMKIVDSIRDDVESGKLKTGADIKAALKATLLRLLTDKVPSTALQLPDSRPGVIMIVGVNGSGKTTTLGKLAHRFGEEGAQCLMIAGDTFRAAASEQLEVWAERTGSQFVRGEGENARPATVLVQGVQKAMSDEAVDIVLADTSGRLHTNDDLMEELQMCKRVVQKTLPGAPHEVLMVLDGTTGLNMLPQAREFNQMAGLTGFVLTKLDGTARGGCVVSVVDELRIPVKFIGVGEGLKDLQPFDAQEFVDALFP